MVCKNFCLLVVFSIWYKQISVRARVVRRTCVKAVVVSKELPCAWRDTGKQHETSERQAVDPDAVPAEGWVVVTPRRRSV